jgi:hypothetical protein
MPSKTEKQRKYIFYKRSLYKNKKNTPKSWKWIWEKGWNQIKESYIKSFNDFINSKN